MRTCGTCTLCCKLLGIPELKKMPGVWCGVCSPGNGCGVYPDRPQSCQNFQCLWLAMPTAIPDLMKPNLTHAVLWEVPKGEETMAFMDQPDITFPRADVIVNEDPAYLGLGDSAKGPLRLLIKAILDKGLTICFVNGSQRRMMYLQPAVEGEA